jgi:hypothetical protein
VPADAGLVSVSSAMTAAVMGGGSVGLGQTKQSRAGGGGGGGVVFCAASDRLRLYHVGGW